MSCDGCGRDLPCDEIAKVLAVMRGVDWSKMVLREEIGIAVANTDGIERLAISAPEFVGRIPARTDVPVVGEKQA